MDDWKKQLDELLKQEQEQEEAQGKAVQQQKNAAEQNRKKAIEFVNDIVLPAFRELERGFQDRGLPARTDRENTGTSILIEVRRQGEGVAELKAFQYAINVSYDAFGIRPEVACSIGKWPIEKHCRTTNAGEIKASDIINDFLQAYSKTFSRPA